MSSQINSLYGESRAYIESGRSVKDGLHVYHILYGYERDSLFHIFPIIVVADDGRGREIAQDTIVGLLSETDDLYIRAPGQYDPPVAEAHQTTCQVEFIHLTPSSDDNIVDNVTSSNARRISLNIEEQLEQPDCNLYYDIVSAGDIPRALFILDYINNPEIQLPFPTERPEGNRYEQHLDTTIPCYLITNNYLERSQKKPVTMKWLYPRV